MIYGYLRVSSDEQDVNSQKQGVVKFAEAREWKIDEYITDEGVSGGKDPDKRNLGPLLKKLKKDDIVIAAEISRLGRDLYMVMDILHFCMKTGCKIYTVKDNFALDDNIQSKVLAFAFGLAAEIERQMIRQRTKEGLRLRMKLGVLLGRPVGGKTDPDVMCSPEQKEKIIEQFKWGVPERRLADNFNIDRNTLARWLHRWGIKQSQMIERQEKQKELDRMNKYKEGDYQMIDLTDEQRDELRKKIQIDLTIPQIAETMKEYTYEQVYDTILCDAEFNPLYRKHGQKKVRKGKH
jgi:DNA invertase Pin-like site-specific DNA recombinase